MHIPATQVAVIIRGQIKKAFPGTGFSVRTNHASAIRIAWTDGPTSGAVDSIVKRFASGSYDPYSDCWGITGDRWEIDGIEVPVVWGSQFVTTDRTHSPQLNQDITEHVVPRCHIDDFSPDALYHSLTTPLGVFHNGTGHQLVRYLGQYIDARALGAFAFDDLGLTVEAYVEAWECMIAARAHARASTPAEAAKLVSGLINDNQSGRPLPAREPAYLGEMVRKAARHTPYTDEVITEIAGLAW